MSWYILWSRWLLSLQRHSNLVRHICQVCSICRVTEYKGVRESDAPSRAVKIKTAWGCGSVQCFFGMREALGLIPAPPKPGVHLSSQHSGGGSRRLRHARSLWAFIVTLRLAWDIWVSVSKQSKTPKIKNQINKEWRLFHWSWGGKAFPQRSRVQHKQRHMKKKIPNWWSRLCQEMKPIW